MTVRTIASPNAARFFVYVVDSLRLTVLPRVVLQKTLDSLFSLVLFVNQYL